MNKGIVYFVKNNEQLNYAKQANVSAMLAKRYLGLPITAICCSEEKLQLNPKWFDNFIEVDNFTGDKRTAYDQGLNRVVFTYYNHSRSSIFDLTPYEKTLLLDTDYLIQNKQLLEIFQTNYELAANHISSQISGQRESLEERRLSPGGPHMYWATALYFKKSEFSADVFSLTAYIKKHWEHYRRIYNIPRPLFRNDYAFSIAVHMMLGNSNAVLPSLPVKQLNSYVPDRIIDVQPDSILLNNGYTPTRVKRRNLHFMNKWNLESVSTDFERIYDCENV